MGEERRKWKRGGAPASPISSLDDGCLMHIFSFLSPIPDRYNTALVCHRWCYLACHPRLWLRVERPIKSLDEPGVYPDLVAAISAARPGDTILIAAGENYIASSIKIKKPLCLMGGGDLPDDTVLTCSRGSERLGGFLFIGLSWSFMTLTAFNCMQFWMPISSAFEFLSTCKVANLTVRVELGCCLLHRSGRLTIERCILQCEENPLDHLSFPIMSTASKGCNAILPTLKNGNGSDSVTVSRTRIEGGAKAVWTSGDMVLQHVRAIYARRAIFFWFEVGEQ